MNFPVTFNASFAGQQEIFLNASNNEGVLLVSSYSGTWSVVAPPAPTVTLTNLSFAGSNDSFLVGNQYQFAVNGEPGAPVILNTFQTTDAGIVSSTVQLGLMPAQGSLTFPSTWTLTDIGAWVDTITVGGTAASSLEFVVGAASSCPVN